MWYDIIIYTEIRYITLIYNVYFKRSLYFKTFINMMINFIIKIIIN